MNLNRAAFFRMLPIIRHTMNQNALLRLVARLLVFAATVCGERLLNAQSPSGENVSAATLTVMTYNLKFASTNPPNAWSTRRPLMREAIRQIAPDVFGTQEGLYEQLKDIAADLPDYD